MLAPRSCGPGGDLFWIGRTTSAASELRLSPHCKGAALQKVQSERDNMAICKSAWKQYGMKPDCERSRERERANEEYNGMGMSMEVPVTQLYQWG